jgi:hypothetical protein
MPVLQKRAGTSYVSGARRMLASGGGSSSGGGTSMCSSRQLLSGAEECEGCLPEFGKPGHWSAGSLANWHGGLPALLVAFLISPRRRPGDLVVMDLTYHGGCPYPSHLLVPLPRDFRWVHHAPLVRSYGPAASSSSYIWKAAQFGTALCGSGGRSRVPLSVGRVVLHPGRSSRLRPEAGGFLSGDWKAKRLGQGYLGPFSSA